MGMYTELHYNAELKIARQSKVAKILQYMVGDLDEPPAKLPKHPLFKTERWAIMLMMDSYYFDADTRSTLRWDDISNAYYLCIRCNLKNYGSEIEQFIDWIKPYLAVHIDNEELLGFYRYEEDREPTLIYGEESKEGI